LGGIANNYNTNLLLSKDSNLIVIEADEYDRSFHWLSPYMAVITSVDADHLDIYETPEAFRQSFEHFASLILPGGVLIMRKGIDIQPKLQKGVKLYTYSMDEGGDFSAENIKIAKGEIRFDFVTPTEKNCRCSPGCSCPYQCRKQCGCHGVSLVERSNSRRVEGRYFILFRNLSSLQRGL